MSQQTPKRHLRQPSLVSSVKLLERSTHKPKLLHTTKHQSANKVMFYMQSSTGLAYKHCQVLRKLLEPVGAHHPLSIVCFVGRSHTAHCGIPPPISTAHYMGRKVAHLFHSTFGGSQKSCDADHKLLPTPVSPLPCSPGKVCFSGRRRVAPC